jgi:hypothetical protein
VAVFERHSKEAKSQQGASQQVSLSQRYFQSNLDALRNNVQDTAGDSHSKEEIARRLDSIQAQLEADLSDLQKQLPPTPDRSALTELILEAYANREARITDGSKFHRDSEANAQMSEASKGDCRR